MEAELPFLTADVPGVALAARTALEDFCVEELAAYEPSGSGDHVYFGIEKRGLSTHEVLRRLAAVFEVRPRDFGCAGLKDARGVTRQTLSLEHVDPARVEGLELAGMRVLWVSRHTNKLRRGHLAGNRFELRLRSPDGANPAPHLAELRTVLERLVQDGLPNYFGPQRFGLRGDNWRIGRALLEGDALEAAAWIAGRPLPEDPPEVRRARELFEAGDYAAAARAWPGHVRSAVRLARAMARGGSGGKGRRANAALRSVSGEELRFCVSAFQSHLFNRVLARRIAEGTLTRVLEGDLAWRHSGGAVFLVEDPEREGPRAASLEISPSGPLFGRRMTRPEGAPDAVEQEVLRDAEVTPEAFAGRGRYAWKGARRPLRVPLADAALESAEDERGPHLALRFALPSGSYATSLLRELTKS